MARSSPRRDVDVGLRNTGSLLLRSSRKGSVGERTHRALGLGTAVVHAHAHRLNNTLYTFLGLFKAMHIKRQATSESNGMLYLTFEKLARLHYQQAAGLSVDFAG